MPLLAAMHLPICTKSVKLAVGEMPITLNPKGVTRISGAFLAFFFLLFLSGLATGRDRLDASTYC